MDLTHLNTFVAAAEQLSFSLAAEQLHVTQPAVSKRISALEQQLGVRLFDRINRDILLTDAGKALLPRAYRLINELKDTQRALHNLERQVSGSLSLATSHHIGLHRLPPILREFTRRYPEVQLDIRFLDSEVAYEEVLQGRCELAIITLSPHTLPPLAAHLLWNDELVFVAAKDHPLAEQAPLTLSELASHPAIFPGSHTFTQKIAQQLFDQQGLVPCISMSTNYMETIKMMVSIGLAWSVLPKTMLDTELIQLNVQTPSLLRPLGYIQHQQRTASNAVNAFIDILHSYKNAE